MKIAHSRPCFADSDMAALAELLADGFVTNGGRARDFGAALAARFGRNWGIALQSGTDALTAALALMDLPSGSRVAVPAYICSAPLDALAFNDLAAVPVDIDLQTLAISPESLEGKAVDAVIASHLFGVAAPMTAFCGDRLIEDCAQIMPAPVYGVNVGNAGRFTIGSSYGTKLLATGHGGFILGDAPGDYDRAMDLFEHDKREKWHPHLHFLMSDLNAALGLSQLARIDEFLSERRRLAALYREALCCPEPPPGNIYSRFTVEAVGDADLLLAEFEASGIEAKRPVYRPLYRYLDLDDADFPNACSIHKQLISVPVYPGMEDCAVELICDFLKEHVDEMRCRPPA